MLPSTPLYPVLDCWSFKFSHESQTDITCMEWKPCAGNTLAVGCRYSTRFSCLTLRRGVMIWFICSKASAESAARTQNLRSFGDTGAWWKELSFPGISPVTTLSWSPRGRYSAIFIHVHFQVLGNWKHTITVCSYMGFGERLVNDIRTCLVGWSNDFVVVTKWKLFVCRIQTKQ